MSWLARWFRPRPDAHDDPEGADLAASADTVDLVSLLQKVARVQARHGIRIEEIESKIEAGFSDLRHSLATAASDAGSLRFDDCFDAMDALDEAARIAPNSEYAHGLHTVLKRLGSFLERAGYQREASVGQAVDASRFRVVGTTVDDAKPAGTIARVVRAAVLRQGKLVREGEAIVNARSA